MSRLKNFILGAGIVTALSLQPYDVYGRGITGSSSTHDYGQTDKRASPETERRWRAVGKKVWEKNINPIPGPAMKGIKRFSNKYRNYRERTGRETGLGSTIDNNDRKDYYKRR